MLTEISIWIIILSKKTTIVLYPSQIWIWVKYTRDFPATKLLHNQLSRAYSFLFQLKLYCMFMSVHKIILQASTWKVFCEKIVNNWAYRPLKYRKLAKNGFRQFPSYLTFYNCFDKTVFIAQHHILISFNDMFSLIQILFIIPRFWSNIC